MGLGASGGSSPPDVAAAPPSGREAGLAASASSSSSSAEAAAASASGASPVPKLALDHLGLDAGSHNSLDILVIGSQDGLKLQREGVRLHFGVYFHHCTLVLECLCIHAVLKIESMHANVIYILYLLLLLSSIQQNIYLKCIEIL
jgi:hypothetical protein